MSIFELPTPTLTVEAEPTEPVAPESRRRARNSWLVHLPFIALLVVATVPRVIAVWGYRPLLMFFGDSPTYLVVAQNGAPERAASRPFGYSAFLRVMAWTHTIGLIPVVQHLAILVLAVVLYVTLLRLRAPVWLAVAVPTPMLIDGFQIQIEHVALTEVMFTCLVMTAVLLAMRRRITATSAAIIGLVLASATLTRTVALPLIALVIAYLMVRRVGWRPVTACAVAFSIPLVAYAAWFAAVIGPFAVQNDGRFLYARVAPIADCGVLNLSADARRLCDATPVDVRPGSNYYAWERTSPFNTLPADLAPRSDELGREFGLAVIKAQPTAYARLVASDVVHYFSPGRTASFRDTPPSWWDFPAQPASKGQQVVLGGSGFFDDRTNVTLQPFAANFLRGWQSVLGTQGLLLLLCLVLAILGAAFGRRRSGGARRTDAVLLSLTGLTLLVIPAATSVFDYRYALPAAVPLYAAGGWGVLLLLQRRALTNATLDPTARTWDLADDEVVVRHRARSSVPSLVALALIGVLTAAVVFSPVVPAPIYARYVKARAESGELRYSLASQQPWAQHPGWSLRAFEGGVIYLKPSGSTVLVTKTTADGFDAAGGEAVFGLPVLSTTLFPDHPDQSVTFFDRGAVVTSTDGSVRTVLPPLFASWCRRATPCQFGPPTSDALVASDGTVSQSFVNGRLVARPGGVVSAEQVSPAPSSGPVGPQQDPLQPPDVRGG